MAWYYYTVIKYTIIALPKISITFQIKEINSGIMASVVNREFLTLKEIFIQRITSHILHGEWRNYFPYKDIGWNMWVRLSC